MQDDEDEEEEIEMVMVLYGVVGSALETSARHTVWSGTYLNSIQGWLSAGQWDEEGAGEDGVEGGRV